MKSYKEITQRYLKVQKKRSVLTVFGIILSVALITAIATMAVSMRDAVIKEVIRNDGDYHAIFRYVPGGKIDKIINNVEVGKAGIAKPEGYAAIRGVTEKEKEKWGEDVAPYRYLSIVGYDKEALDILPYKIEEGRFPKDSNEIILERATLEHFPKKLTIGDKVVLSIGNRIDSSESEEEFNYEQSTGYDQIGSSHWSGDERFEKEKEKQYTVVGIIENNYLWNGDFITKAITGVDKKNLEGNNYNIYAKFNSVNKVHNKTEKLAEDVGVDSENVEFNEDLLRLYAQSLSNSLNSTFILILIFIISLVVVATVAVIYNSFNISVLERISQFGLLRSIGATPEQIKGLVFKEASILSIIGIPIGLFCGVLAMKIVLYVIGFFKFELFDYVELVISPIVLIASSIIGLITVYLSAYGPAKKAGKISPLEAVRNTGGFKKESLKKARGSRILRSILGMEGEIAYKNLRRNRKRFLITVFSMTISITLFITFSSFSNFMFKVGVADYEERGDIALYTNNESDVEGIYKEIKEISDVKRVYKVRDSSGTVFIENGKLNPKLKELGLHEYDEIKKQGYAELLGSEIMTYGNDNLDILNPYLKEGTIDIDKMNKENGVLVVTTTKAYNFDTEKHLTIDGFDLKVGDKIFVSEYNEDGGTEKLKEVKVMGVLERGFLGNPYNENGSANIILTDEMYKKLMEEENGIYRMLIELEKDGDREPIRKYLSELEETDSKISYIDYAEEAEEERNAVIVMSIFLYGFVAVISLISCINIINTISTNLILRTRELAMLKAVGMSQGSVKRMVALESLYYAIIAAIYGGIAGTGLSYLLYRIVLGINEFDWTIPWKSIFIACVGATFVALVSGAIPLKRINSGNIIDKIKIEE